MHQKILMVLFFVFLTCGFILMIVPGFASAIDLSKGIILDVPQERIESQFGKIPPSQLTRQDSIALASYRFTADTLKVLAILVEWSDRPHTYSRGAFDTLLFSRNVLPGGSVADYFYEVSYGKANIVGQVIDWYNAGTYNVNFNFESLFPILNPVIDYSQFDGDHNGDVDAVVFIRSGNGMEDSQNPNDIWSYTMVYSPGHGPGPFDGVHIPRWNTSPETQPLHDSSNPHNFSGVDTLNKIRVFCHELTHCFGLPDLYDYDDKTDTTTYYTPGDYNDHPVNDWCLMGYYGYGLFSIGSQVPSHLCGWSKKEIGWITPIVLPKGTHNQIVIHNIETTNDSSLYSLPINLANGEYFLLEYRNPNSTAKFDKINSDYSCYFWPALSFGGDPLDRGLLITHVHDSLGAYYYRLNDGTPTYPHYTVKIEDAGYNPGRDAHTNPGGWVTDSAQWWYPYETQIAAPFSNNVSGQEVFGPTTYPNSDGYFGPSGIVVRVDSIVNDKLYAYINIPTPAFSLISPPDSALTRNVVTFDWTDAYPWPYGEVRYDLYVSTSSNFHPDSTVIHYNLLSSQYTGTVGIKTHYWKVRAYHNSEETWSTQTWSFYAYMCGDVNADGVINSSDVVFLINYLFVPGSPPPNTLASGDVNGNGTINASDVVYLINYLFIGGPAPCS